MHSASPPSLSCVASLAVKNQHIFLEENECEWRWGVQRGRWGAGCFQGCSAVKSGAAVDSERRGPGLRLPNPAPTLHPGSEAVGRGLVRGPLGT